LIALTIGTNKGNSGSDQNNTNAHVKHATRLFELGNATLGPRHAPTIWLVGTDVEGEVAEHGRQQDMLLPTKVHLRELLSNVNNGLPLTVLVHACRCLAQRDSVFERQVNVVDESCDRQPVLAVFQAQEKSRLVVLKRFQACANHLTEWRGVPK
jgi:hypothetical protein